jgi:hypothetical protein
MDEKKRELYDEVCRVLTWWEHPEEYPCGEEDFNKHISNEMYEVLVKVQNSMCETYGF